MEEISYTDNIRAMLPEFEESTGIQVTIETVPYADQASRVLQEFSQGSSTYDVVFIGNTYGSGYFGSGYVEDLSTFADADDEFGIDGPPETTDELLEVAQMIHEGTDVDIAGITMRAVAGVHAVYPWAGLLRSFGGGFYDQDGDIAIDSAESVAATEFWVELLSEYGPSGVSNFDWEQNRIAFTQGQATMTIDATANGPFNEDDSSSVVAGNVGYAAIPYAPGVEPGENTNNSLAVHALYMNSASENKETAWKFMSWATSQEVQGRAVDNVEAVGVTGYLRRDNKLSVAVRAAGRASVAYFLGIHDIDALQWITRKQVVEVQAMASGVTEPTREQALAVLGTLRLSGGAVVQIESAWNLPEDYPTDLDAAFRLVCAGGVLSVHSFDAGMHIAGSNFTFPVTAGASLHGRAQGPLAIELEAFVRACAQDGLPPVTMREAASAVKVVAAQHEALVNGGTVKVEQVAMR